MHTRDGVRLDADVYYPDAPGEFPVLLMRQPYGRAIASTVVYAHPQWYAAQGFIVVIQDVRGRGSSEGEFHLFAHELDDGYDTVQWAAQLPRSTGEVGMYGFSYQGMTQLYAAAAKPPALKTICPSMVAYDLYADWAYEGGAFCYQMNLGWALQLACETARRDGDEPAYRELYAAAHALSFPDPVCPRAEILERLAPDSFYHDWLGNPDPTSSYWTTLSPQAFLGDVDLPMLHIGGWFDTHLRGTLRLYRAIAPRSQHPQHLWVGPWAHLPWGRRVGMADYGTDANSPMDAVQVQWFNQFLKGKDTGVLQHAPVHLFDLGQKQWREFNAYPPDAVRSLDLLSDGLAIMGDQHGELVADGAAPLLPDVLVHDPWRPVPAMGGHATIPTGPCDRSLLDSRTDVATYTSDPVAEPWSIVGEPVVELHCSADAPSFDLCAVLSEVTADGRVIYISQGYLRVDAAEEGAIAPHQMTLQPTCITIPPGSALRLSLSPTCFPAYAVNPGTGTQPYDSRLIDAKVITITLASGSLGRSRLMLPHIFSAAAR